MWRCLLLLWRKWLWLGGRRGSDHDARHLRRRLHRRRPGGRGDDDARDLLRTGRPRRRDHGSGHNEARYRKADTPHRAAKRLGTEWPVADVHAHRFVPVARSPNPDCRLMPVSDARMSSPNLMFERDFSNPLSREPAIGRLIADSRGESQATSIAGNLRAPTLLCTFHDGRDKADTCRSESRPAESWPKCAGEGWRRAITEETPPLEPAKALSRAHP